MGKNMKLKFLKPSDFELINTTGNGKYNNVYARIYKNSTGRVTCKISECKKVKGVFKRRRLKIDDLIDESFEGSCVLKVYQNYMQLRKAEENKHKTFLASVTIVSNDAKPEYRCTVNIKMVK